MLHTKFWKDWSITLAYMKIISLASDRQTTDRRQTDDRHKYVYCRLWVIGFQTMQKKSLSTIGRTKILENVAKYVLRYSGHIKNLNNTLVTGKIRQLSSDGSARLIGHNVFIRSQVTYVIWTTDIYTSLTTTLGRMKHGTIIVLMSCTGLNCPDQTHPCPNIIKKWVTIGWLDQITYLNIS